MPLARGLRRIALLSLFGAPGVGISSHVDRKYRAKVMIALVVGCLSLWGIVGILAIRSF